MQSKKIQSLLFSSMNLTIICLIVCIVNICKLNWSNAILSAIICYLLYSNTVTLKRLTSISKGKKENGMPGTYLG